MLFKDKYNKKTTMEQISATFTQLGLRSSKAVAAHILLENAYESNLVPDIYNVDYLADNNGPTSLQKLEGLSTFVDDLFVFGYLEEKEVVVSRGKTLCTSGKGGSAQIVVSRILCAVCLCWGFTAQSTQWGHVERGQFT